MAKQKPRPLGAPGRFSLAEDGRPGDISSNVRQKENETSVVRLQQALGRAGYKVKVQGAPIRNSLDASESDRGTAQAFGKALSAFEAATGR